MCEMKLFAAFLATSLLFVFSCAEPQCERINKIIPDLHIQCGYNLTARFNYEKHFNSASRAIASLKNTLKNCSAFVDVMVCSLFLPRCTEEVKGPYLPCRGVCYDYANDCKEVILRNGLEWTAAMCDILPEKDNPQTTQGYRGRCFTPPNYKDSGKKYKHNCSDVVIGECKGIPGFTKTVVSEETQKLYQRYIKSKISFNATDPCSQRRKEIVCAENLPACVDDTAAFLCRDNCFNFFNVCTTPFFYGSDMCMEFPKREGTKNPERKWPICKQTHWPRSENWELHRNPTTPVTPGTRFRSTTQGLKVKSDSIKIWTSKPPIKTDAVHSPAPGIRGQQKVTKQSGSNKLLIGVAVTLVLMVLVAAAIGVFMWYRRKKSRQFNYQKQILYYEDKQEEFEIRT